MASLLLVTYLCFLAEKVSGSRFWAEEVKLLWYFNGELTNEELLFTLGWRWEWKTVAGEGAEPQLF